MSGPVRSLRRLDFVRLLVGSCLASLLACSPFLNHITSTSTSHRTAPHHTFTSAKALIYIIYYAHALRQAGCRCNSRFYPVLFYPVLSCHLLTLPSPLHPCLFTATRFGFRFSIFIYTVRRLHTYILTYVVVPRLRSSTSLCNLCVLCCSLLSSVASRPVTPVRYCRLCSSYFPTYLSLLHPSRRLCSSFI